MLIYTKQKGGQISSLIKILDTPPFLTIGCRGPWRQQCQPLEIKVDLPSKIENIPVGQEWEGSASSYKTQSFYKAKKGVCSFGKSSRKHLTIWPNFGPKAPHLSPGKHLGEVDSWVARQAWGLAEVQCRVAASQSGHDDDEGGLVQQPAKEGHGVAVLVVVQVVVDPHWPGWPV